MFIPVCDPSIGKLQDSNFCTQSCSDSMCCQANKIIGLRRVTCPDVGGYHNMRQRKPSESAVAARVSRPAHRAPLQALHMIAAVNGCVDNSITMA
ncbi:hypothetical protein EVAR_31454_1 [Eumeta japonica]|uniref:Uncharacterized protein n=1 Tax=Eumeta variegata TaxID=151549 RepID=A0A4C1UXZ0_EUMVA|nr:hypothetical protein EVAR_31454_1 [Eumeta japonica]